MKCNSCNEETSEGVSFPCPKCQEQIFRCDKCKQLSIEWKCTKCGQEGP